MPATRVGGLARSFVTALAALTMAGCVGRQAQPALQPPLPPPPPPRVAPPAPTSAPMIADWQNGPLSPGDWRYRADAGASEARFGEAGATLLTLRCTSSGELRLTRMTAVGPITLVTTFGSRVLPTTPTVGDASASLAAGDGALDEMAFSRGRLLVRDAGGGDLVVPAWPEIGRVVEDCRR